MGCGMSTEEKEGKARNEEIENQLKRDRMQQRNEIKMLLLGTFGALRRVQADWRSRIPDRGLTVLEQVPVNPESRRF